MNYIRSYAGGVSSVYLRSFTTSVAKYYLYEGMHLVKAEKGSYAHRVLDTGKWEKMEQLAYKIDTNGRLLKDADEADKIFQSLRNNMKQSAVNNHN